ncbi:MAG: hypothetical protein IK115_13335 [Lachnospiraceae bacterium]|nr:hypothetical protein [Lachnospiraceae bacterium]
MELKKKLFRLLICAVLALVSEIFIFNFGTIRTLGNKEALLCEDLWINGPSEYETPHIVGEAPVENIFAEDIELTGADSFSLQPMLADEGNVYPYALPYYRIVPEVPESAYRDIYSYGRVRELYAYIDVPEGATLHIGRIRANIVKPFRFRPLRFLLLFAIAAFLCFSWGSLPLIPCRRKSPLQWACILLSLLALTLLGRKLSSTNERLMTDPPEHHSQYQELTEALEEGHVDLRRKPASEELLAKENPYDTLALLAEGADFRMDYAYYEGKYYVYFGIVPEVLFFLPWYELKGEMPENRQLMWRMYALLCAGAFLLLWELVWRFKKGDFPFLLYLAPAWGICLFSNHVFLVSRPDVYNIPLLSGVAFLFCGLGLCFAAAAREKAGRIALLAAGSFCLACVAGCRPQLILFMLPLLFLFLLGENAEGKLSLKERMIFTKKSIPETMALLLPVIPVAVLVCWYNAARFGSPLEFGATYSLTTNDMNLRGFNLDRLFRGLYAFLFQPPNTIGDFPYLTSSVLKGEYMGRNLVEFSFGGFFAAVPLLLVCFVPLFRKGMFTGRQQRAMVLSLLLAALVIAAFDVNGAGVLYRYTCDVAPGLLMAALILWLPLISVEGTARKLFSLLLLLCFFYSLQCFCASGDVYSLSEASPALFEKIRAFFT